MFDSATFSYPEFWNAIKLLGLLCMSEWMCSFCVVPIFTYSRVFRSLFLLIDQLLHPLLGWHPLLVSISTFGSIWALSFSPFRFPSFCGERSMSGVWVHRLSCFHRGSCVGVRCFAIYVIASYICQLPAHSVFYFWINCPRRHLFRFYS